MQNESIESIESIELMGSKTEKGYLAVKKITAGPKPLSKFNVEGEGEKVFNYLQVRQICDRRGPIYIDSTIDLQK